jgi:O-methyltransferase involved in polyketide biosynthesis
VSDASGHETQGAVPVVETLYWTFYHRAVEARRPDTVLADPKAVELLARLDFPFEERFGPASPLQAQWQALRASCFDRAVRTFLAAHPAGTVVALGEGLETQLWRVDNGCVRWLTVDLPEVIALRSRLLGQPPRARSLACSALDERWLDTIDPASGVLVTAQGLLMYLDPPDVRWLLATCARRLPGCAMVFDAVPRWFSEHTRSGAIRTRTGYVAPPMPWALDRAELEQLRALPGVAELTELRLPRGRGALFGVVLPLASLVPALRRLGLVVVSMRFAEAS